MPTRSKQPARSGVDQQRTAVVRKSDRSLPHELDETADAGAPQEGAREVVKQAARDVRRGLRDTERRGIPSDVPGPSEDPQRTRGADVPAHGKR